MVSLQELKEFFRHYTPCEDPFKIDDGTNIINQSKFIRTHLDILSLNQKNRGSMPYYKRIVKYYEKIKKEPRRKDH